MTGCALVFVMRQFVCVVVGLAIAGSVGSSADARNRHHRGLHQSSINDADFRRAAQSYARVRPGLATLVPRDWGAAPRNPASPGSRFVSPTGDAWLWVYAVPADEDALDQYGRRSRLRRETT